MDQKEIEGIIERDLPGQRMSKKSLINENEASDSFGTDNLLETEQPEASTPRFETLREKYLSDKFFGFSDSSDQNSFSDVSNSDTNDNPVDTVEKDEDVIVAVKPKESTNFLDDSSQLKATVISGAEKKVIGQQG